MPAFVKSRFGASGKSDDDGTMVCCFSRKKSRNDSRISAEVMISHSNWLDAQRKDAQEWRSSVAWLRAALQATPFQNAIYPQLRALLSGVGYATPCAYCFRPLEAASRSFVRTIARAPAAELRGSALDVGV